jgi:cell division protein FtsB
MKTKSEKLKLAAQLLDQDKSYRVIAKRTHLSLNDISAIKKQKFADEKSQTTVAADSKCTEAYKLFEIKSPLVDVAIKLGLDEKTTRKHWAEYRRLKNIDGLTEIYDELGPDLNPFLELYSLMQKHEFAPSDVDYVAKKLTDIGELERQVASLKTKIKELQALKLRLNVDVDSLQQRWGMLEKYIDELKDEIDVLELHIDNLNKEKQVLEEDEI